MVVPKTLPFFSIPHRWETVWNLRLISMCSRLASMQTEGVRGPPAYSLETTPTTSISNRKPGSARPTSMNVLAGGSSTRRGACFW